MRSRKRWSSRFEISLIGKRARARGRELDREWEPVEPLAHIADGVAVALGDDDVGKAGGALAEQLDRIVDRQRRDRPEPLPGEPEAFAARCENAQRRRPREKLLREPSDLRDDMLAIVEHEQHVLRGKELGDPIER